MVYIHVKLPLADKQPKTCKVWHMIDVTKQGVANRLRIIFNDSNDTLEEFAAVADKSKQAASGWLKTGRASKDSLIIIANHYGYNLTWLVSGDGQPKTSKDQYLKASCNTQKQNHAKAIEKLRHIFTALSLNQDLPSSTMRQYIEEAIHTLNFTHSNNTKEPNQEFFPSKLNEKEEILLKYYQSMPHDTQDMAITLLKAMSKHKRT